MVFLTGNLLHSRHRAYGVGTVIFSRRDQQGVNRICWRCSAPAAEAAALYSCSSYRCDNLCTDRLAADDSAGNTVCVAVRNLRYGKYNRGLYMTSVFTYQEDSSYQWRSLYWEPWSVQFWEHLPTCLKSPMYLFGLMLCMLAGTALSYASDAAVSFKFMNYMSQSEASPAICLIRPFLEAASSCMIPAVFCFCYNPAASIVPALITEFRSYKA